MKKTLGGRNRLFQGKGKSRINPQRGTQERNEAIMESRNLIHGSKLIPFLQKILKIIQFLGVSFSYYKNPTYQNIITSDLDANHPI